ncbi:MAG: ABC transporter ATP-binding protein [Planctomycetes bacterium]|nr:ABC transporter ATP-binding protein [Planctomycetota bacterium]
MEDNAVVFENVSKSFATSGSRAVDRVSLTIRPGEFVTILGSSGSGKTTLLKMVNRLYDPDEGRVLLHGEDVRQANPVTLRRRIGYVIQQSGLFPHMSVAKNIATVPNLLGWDKARIRDRVDELLELVGLDPTTYRKRYPRQLSGGQQQRVGLARALAAGPAVMLLDEPFGAVDAITRQSLQEELLRIHAGLGKTFLLGTHDITEAFRLGGRVVVMDGGRVRQFDTPSAIATAPADGFVRSLVAAEQEREAVWKEVRHG